MGLQGDGMAHGLDRADWVHEVDRAARAVDDEAERSVLADCRVGLDGRRDGGMAAGAGADVG